MHRTFDDVIDHITLGQPCNLMGADAIELTPKVGRRPTFGVQFKSEVPMLASETAAHFLISSDMKIPNWSGVIG